MPEGNKIFSDRSFEREELEMHFGLWPTLSWFGGLLLATSLVGFVLALTGFLLLFFNFRAQVSPIRTVIFSASGVSFMCGMALMLNRDFPPGLLQAYFNLPWPLT